MTDPEGLSAREARSTVAIAQGRLDAMLMGRFDVLVAQRLAEDLTTIAAYLAPLPESTVPAALELLRAAIEDELASLPEHNRVAHSDFDAGAAAAYHFVLSRLAAATPPASPETRDA